MTLVYTKLHFDPLLFENILGKLSYKIFILKKIPLNFELKLDLLIIPFYSLRDYPHGIL